MLIYVFTSSDDIFVSQLPSAQNRIVSATLNDDAEKKPAIHWRFQTKATTDTQISIFVRNNTNGKSYDIFIIIISFHS